MHQRLGKQAGEVGSLYTEQGTTTMQTSMLQCQVPESDCAALAHAPATNALYQHQPISYSQFAQCKALVWTVMV